MNSTVLIAMINNATIKFYIACNPFCPPIAGCKSTVLVEVGFLGGVSQGF